MIVLFGWPELVSLFRKVRTAEIQTILKLTITPAKSHFAGFINTIALFQSSELRFKLSWLAGLLMVAAAAAIPSWSREYLFTTQKGPAAPFLEGSEVAYAVGGFLVGFGTVRQWANERMPW